MFDLSSRAAVFVVVVALAGCGKGSSDPGLEPDRSRVSEIARLQSEIARLESELRALAVTTGCAAADCRIAPHGSKPCGGPRDYLAYCSTTTDSAALQKKASELQNAERDLNIKTGAVSDCSVFPPPPYGLHEGRCVAGGPIDGPETSPTKPIPVKRGLCERPFQCPTAPADVGCMPDPSNPPSPACAGECRQFLQEHCTNVRFSD